MTRDGRRAMASAILLLSAVSALRACVGAEASVSLASDDIYNLKDVRDPQRSPDGKWVAYVVPAPIKDGDKNDSDIWMASWDGTQEIQLTSSPDGESQPRWSPDNKYLVVRLVAAGRQGRPAVADEPRRRRSHQGQRRQGRRLRVRLGARRQADRVRGQRARPARSERRRQGPAARTRRRPRRPSSSTGTSSSRTSTATCATSARISTCSTSHEEGRGPDDRDGLRRVVARLVARRLADRVRQQARHRRPRSPRQHRRLGHRGEGRRRSRVRSRRLRRPTMGRSRGAPTASRLPISPAKSSSTPPTTRTSWRSSPEPAASRAPGGVPRSPIRPPQWSRDGPSLTFLVVDDRSQYPARIDVGSGRLERLVDGPRVVGNLTTATRYSSLAVR